MEKDIYKEHNNNEGFYKEQKEPLKVEQEEVNTRSALSRLMEEAEAGKKEDPKKKSIDGLVKNIRENADRNLERER